MKRLLIFGFSLLVVLGVAHSNAIAQDQQESDNSLLPEIDPQDIEIRSQFKARFPGLRREMLWHPVKPTAGRVSSYVELARECIRAKIA